MTQLHVGASHRAQLLNTLRAQLCQLGIVRLVDMYGGRTSGIGRWMVWHEARNYYATRLTARTPDLAPIHARVGACDHALRRRASIHRPLG